MPRAGLDPSVVTEAGAALADELGLARLSISTLADRLGVRPPSLYKHVDGLDDLTHRVALLAATELGDALAAATDGLAGRDALHAAARAHRDYALAYPGRYAATVGSRPADADDPLAGALDRALTSFTAVLRGYGVDPVDDVHALRYLRSCLHGFASLEAGRGFQLGTDVDASFDWLVDAVDRGLRAAAGR